MASIVAIDTYNEAGNKLLKLLNGEAGRILSIGTGWTSLAVGFRFMATREAAGDVTGSPKFTYGLSSGPNTPWSNPANALGFYQSPSSWTDTSPDADGQGHYITGSSSYVVGAKNGGTVRGTSGALIAYVNDYIPNDRGTARYLRTHVFTVTKGGTNWSLGQVNQSTATNSFDAGHRTAAQLITALEQMNLTGVCASLGSGQFGTGSSTIANSAVAEATYGYLDSVFFSWDRSNPAGIAISDVFVAKWA